MLTRGVLAFGRAVLRRGNIPVFAASFHKTYTRTIHFTGSQLTTYYTKEHEWITVDDGVGTVGITKYAQEQLGDIVYCDFSSEVGSEYAMGDVFATVESVKAASDLYFPVSGEVIETNDSVAENPNLIAKSPTVEGWLVKMKLSDASELDNLLNLDEYEKLTAEEEK